MSDFPRIGVAVIVIDKGRILLGRSTKEPIVGKWVVPGGRIEPFEAVQATGEREVLEETGLTVQVRNVMFVSEIVAPPAEHRIILYVNGILENGEIKAGSDLSEVRWVDFRELDSIADDMSELTVDAISKLGMYFAALRNNGALLG